MHLVHIREQEVENGERNNGEQSRHEHAHTAAAALLGLSSGLLGILHAQEEEPDEEGNTAEAHIRSAHPEQLAVHNLLELLSGHDSALISRGGVQVAQNQLLSQKNTGNGTHRVECLGKVQAAHSRLIRAQRNHVGVAGSLQHRATTGHHENGNEINLKALVNTGRNVAERTRNVHPQTNQHPLLIREFLDKNGSKDSQHGIGAIEGHLHQSSLLLRNGEDILEGRHQVVGHIIQQAPQGETADQHEEHRAELARHHRSQVFLGIRAHTAHFTIIIRQVNTEKPFHLNSSPFSLTRLRACGNIHALC